MARRLRNNRPDIAKTAPQALASLSAAILPGGILARPIEDGDSADGSEIAGGTAAVTAGGRTGAMRDHTRPEASPQAKATNAVRKSTATEKAPGPQSQSHLQACCVRFCGPHRASCSRKIASNPSATGGGGGHSTTQVTRGDDCQVPSRDPPMYAAAFTPIGIQVDMRFEPRKLSQRATDQTVSKTGARALW